MSAAGLVIVCALELLGRSPDTLPRIEVLEHRPSTVSANAAAFADHDTGVIYLIASAPAFSDARAAQKSASKCSNLEALKVVASFIVHEEWHLKNGPDEAEAYYAQLMELHRLGLGPGTFAYASVQRAMQAALAGRERNRPKS